MSQSIMLFTPFFSFPADSWRQIDQNLCGLWRNLGVLKRHTARANRKNLGPDSIDHECPIWEGQPRLDRRRSIILKKKPCLHKWLRINENCLMCRQWLFNSDRLMGTLLLAPLIVHTPEVPLADLLYDEDRFGPLGGWNLAIFSLDLDGVSIWSIYVLNRVFAWLAPSYRFLVG